MEEKSPSAGQSALFYGLLLGVAMIVVHLILYLANIQKETSGIVVSFIVMIAGVVLASLDYRNKKLKGFISYGKAVKIGFLTMLFAAFIVAPYTFVYHGYINTNDILEAKIEATQDIYNMGMESEQEEQWIKIQEFVHTPLVYAGGALLTYPFFGIIIALITSIFIKKEENVSLG